MTALQPLKEAFARAADRTEVHQEHYVFAGHPVCLRIAGSELAQRIGAAFAHLRSTCTAAPDLAIDLWDEEATQVPQPTPAGLPDLESSWEVDGGRLDASTDASLLRWEASASVLWLDRRTPRLVGCTRNAASLSLHQRAKPLQLPLTVWSNDLGLHMTHAGCVAEEGQGVLIAGKSGAGKSTSSVACALQGLDYLGDDYVALAREEDGAFTAHSLFGSAYLFPERAGCLPELAPHVIHGSAAEQKSLVFVSQALERRMAVKAQVRALVLPRVRTGSESRIRRARPAEALLAFAPNSLLTMRPRLGRAAFERLADLVERLPVWWLDAGRDFAGIAARVREVLARATV